MGRRNSRKNNLKNLEIERFEPLNILDREVKTIQENLSKIEHQKYLLELRAQIKHYISNIYNEFSKELDKRRAERLHYKANFDEKSLPKLTITHDFTKRINDLLTKISDDESIEEIKDCVYKNASSFVEQLKQTFSDMVNTKKKLQVLLMYDSYTFLENLSAEISRILSLIFRKDEKAIPKYHKTHFYKRVMKNRPDLIEYLVNNKSPCYSELQILKKFKKYEKRERLEESGIMLYENIENEIFEISSCRLSTASSLSVDKDSLEFINFSNIDQVVKYIEGKTGKNKTTKRKTKKGAKKISKTLNDEIDKEVEEFEKKLNRFPPLEKMKPNFTEGFLQELREKINRTRITTKVS